MTVPLAAANDELDLVAGDWSARRPASTVEAIVDLLKNAIVRGDLPGGMPLRQERLAQKFGISKIPLREALAKLDAGGFVTTHPRRGVFVSEIDPEKVDEIFQLRLLIEPDLLRHAVPRMKPSDIAAAAAIIEKFEISETSKLGEVNWELHRALYAPSRRQLSLQILDNLHLHVERYVRLHMGVIDPGKASNNEHRALLDACRKGDVELAVHLLSVHLDHIRQAISNFVGTEATAAASRPE